MTDDPRADALAIAETVRTVCIDRFLQAYEAARISGLCCEGATEVALGQVRRLKPRVLLDPLGDGNERD